MPEQGLYRTTKPMPGHEADFPEGVLVFVGRSTNGGATFVVRPGDNRNNRWYWGEPTTPLRSTIWAQTLVKLPPEGFYTLPKRLDLGDGGVWLENALVQLGYNGEGKGIIFVGEQHDGEERNCLQFSDKGVLIDDGLLNDLRWAPILPVSKDDNA